MARPITADCHVSPPVEVWEDLPERYRANVPHLEERADGVYLVRPSIHLEAMRGSLAEAMSGTAEGRVMVDMNTQRLAEGVKIDPDDEVELARLLTADCCPQARPGFTAEAYVAELERDGVVGAVLIGGPADTFGVTDDLECDIAKSRLQNDWLHDTFKSDLHRFAPGMSLPFSDVTASVAELERAAGLGLRPVLLPDVIPTKPYVLPEWEPLWEAAAGLGVPLVMHVTAHRGFLPWSTMTSFQHGQGGTTGFALISSGMVETVAWFACSGILERHPDLKVVMTECSAGWLAWAMQFIDHHYFGRFGNDYLTEQGHVPMKVTEAPPSYYIKRQISCTFMDDPVAIHNREFTGLDCLMWGNDYPHHEGVFPDSQKWVEKQFAGVPEAEITAIVHDNAARGLTV